MAKRFCLLCIVVILAISCNGCYDAREINDWTYVNTIGLDKGVANKLRLTVQVPTLKGGGKQGSAESGKNTGDFGVVTVDCSTFPSGGNLLNVELGRRVNYMHTKYLVISEELAREGVGDILNGIIRNRQIRRTMYIIVVKGKADAFVRELTSFVGTDFAKTQEELMADGKESGIFDSVSYREFYSDMKSTYNQPHATLGAVNDFSSFKEQGPGTKVLKPIGDYNAGQVPRKGGSKIEFLGTALFDGDKMVGMLSGTESRAMLMVRGDFVGSTYTLPDPEKPEKAIAISLRESKAPEVKLEIKDGKPIIRVKIGLEGDILVLQSTIPYDNPEKKKVLEKKVSQSIKSDIDKALNKCQKLDADIFNFGDVAVRHFTTIPEWEKYSWMKQFKNAQIDTEVKFTIRTTGTKLRSSPIPSSKGVS